MAFSLYASSGGTTTQLSDGNPFWLESASGLSSENVVRFSQSGPLQDGVSDLGYRLTPRTLELHLLFYATTDTLLDTYRSALLAAFRPLADISTFLYFERDDGETRRLDCRLTDEIKIELVPEEKAAKLHRATIRLRAANPLYSASSATIYTINHVSPGTYYGTIVLSSDVNARPLLTITGPITDPIISNITVGDAVNLTGLTLGSAESVSLDLRTGNKRFYNQSGSSIFGSITANAATLLDFHLATAPYAAGGTNVISVNAGSAGSVRIEFIDQYTSF